MHQAANNDIWQVEVGGQIYDAPLAELPEWIDEGSLQPEDKVRKGNLRWIEARKVPSLVPFFNARANGEPMPFARTITDAALPEGGHTESQAIESKPATAQTLAANTIQTTIAEGSDQPMTAAVPAVPGQCSVHPERASAYVCNSCETEFCKVCPRSYGGEVRICPECGSLCTDARKAAENSKRAAVGAAAGDEQFGFSDLGRAFAHPFRFKPSLVFGGLMFMFFTLGQSASALGGMFFVVAAIFCGMLANMLTFGVLANTVENFTQGRLDADFMPSFDDFSLWDDVIHPFFLSIGVYISSFGPFVLVMIIGLYLVVSAAGDQMKKYNEELTRVPGTQFYSPDRTAEQSQEVRDLLERVKQQNEKRLARQQEVVRAADSSQPVPNEPGTAPMDPEAEALQFEKTMQEAQANQLEGSSPAGSGSGEPRFREAMGAVLKLAAPLVVFGGLALLWGLFYFPAACAVAGYTRSFVATINPLVGLDTIKRLGGTYVVLLVMCFLLLIAAGAATIAVHAVLSPFNLPALGNVPAAAVGSLITFYFSIVFSCVIGYAMFKSADRLKLYK